MNRGSEHVSILGFLFSLAIAFWGNQMATYIYNGPRPSRFPQKQISGELRELMKDETSFSETKKALDELTTKTAALWPIQDRAQGQVLSATLHDIANSKDLPKAKEEAVKKWMEAFDAWLLEDKQWEISNWKHILLFALTIVAGTVFLVDIMCVIWWYARYIYKIQPTPSFRTHFVDFGICAAFNGAASRWTDMRVFLCATAFASALLIYRFRCLYFSHDATGTDKIILKSAKENLLAAFSVSCVILLAALIVVLSIDWPWNEIKLILHPIFAIILSGIGIRLTWKYRKRILMSADTHEVRRLRFKPMALHWPEPVARNRSAKQLVREATRSGLNAFEDVFRTNGEKYERLFSRVHAHGDLSIQSYILSAPSWKVDPNSDGNAVEVKTKEIAAKATIVGLSHWLDDLVDGRAEYEINDKLLKKTDLLSNMMSTEDDRAATAFKLIYSDIIERHTGKGVFDSVVGRINSAAGLRHNVPYLYIGLNRVALGAVFFSPRVGEARRWDLIDEHNDTLNHNVLAATAGPEWTDGMRAYIKKYLINDIQGDGDKLGAALLALTTKTAQELGMASEQQILNFPLSVLYSVTYAPLLYFHDIDKELDAGEMAVLEPFDLGYEQIIPWLENVRSLIEKTGKKFEDDRHQSRLMQLEMAYCCFKSSIPEVAKEDLERIYCSPNWEPQLIGQ